MRRIIVVLLLSIIPVARASYTYTLTDCAQTTFEACIYNGMVGGSFVKYIEAGDVIVLPAGSATWGNPAGHGNAGIVYITTAITVKGHGDDTIITMHDDGPTYANGVIALWAQVVWKDMKIKGASTRPVTTFTIGASNIRITNVTYEGQSDPTPGDGNAGDGYFVFNQGYWNTLIDHCRISSVLGTHEWIFSRGVSNSWQTANRLGTNQVDIFVEDCVMSGAGYSDANANATHVFRFNTITGNIKLDAHGKASNSPARSFRHVEYYNNTWTNGAMSSSAAMEVRGGTAMVFNNTSVSGGIYLRDYAYDNAWPNFGIYNIGITAGSPVSIVTPTAHGYETGWRVFVDCSAQGIYGFYTVTKVNATTFTIVEPLATSGTGYNVRRHYTAYDYPIPDQVGQGRDGVAMEPAYVWNNTQGGGTWPRTVATPTADAQTLYKAQTGNSTSTFTERDVIQSNRDFFAESGFDTLTGVTVGTRAVMDAMTPSTAGYGFWVTNEGSWNTTLPANTSGRLYRWTGSAWELYYTPYTYPHPNQVQTDVAIPVASPGAGTYDLPQTVTITAASPNATTIRYTTNGTVPTASIGTVYSGPITISSNVTLQAIGYDGILANSTVYTGNYVITGQTFAPVATPAAGSYNTAQNIILTSATVGADIYYTTDGSTPTIGSTHYTGPISVVRTSTIKALAVKSGLSNSSVTSAPYDISLEVGNIDPLSGMGLAFYDTERGTYARFTSPVTGTLDSISIYCTNSSATLDIKLALYHDANNDLTNITLVSGSPTEFTNVGTWATRQWKQFPVSFAVTAGQVYHIALQCSESGSMSYGYSVEAPGTFQKGYLGYPGPASPVPYSDAWQSTRASLTGDYLKVAVKGRVSESVVTDTVGIPTASPNGAVYLANQSVTLSSSTSGASIYYTTDGSTPTTGSTLYSGPISILLGGEGTTLRTIKAIAVKGGLIDSAVMTENYSMFVPSAGLTFSTLNVGTLVIP